MVFDATPNEVVRKAVAALDAAGVAYMLTGSLASSLHGLPRSTQDIDFVIAPDDRTLGQLISEFSSSRYYLSRTAAIQALRQDSLFNVIDLESGWKIDFIIRKSREFSRAEFDRRITAELLGMKIVVATPEDVVISKLEWSKRFGSERQLDDAAGIVKTQGPRLDTGHVERWVVALELAPQWATTLEKSR